ncbi:MAG TPA: NADP-dependent isocitrate dehydrogenase [Cytophagales bacterium]|nr:NADP-dependent isocitrate dehydrogenase [Cytophagales bacterium]
MTSKNQITIAYGDGIGPEIMNATLNILEKAGAQLEYDEIEIGEKVYLQGISAGIQASAWDSLKKTKVFLKSPITTPQGGGFKSLNVTTRKTLGLYANVRPSKSFHPYVATKHPVMDVVIIRENEEDLYTGIEYQQSQEVVQCLKIISRPGCEKIVRYAFEYARAYGRKKVTCFSKDNIMKMTDGLFHKLFDEIGKEYPDIEKDHWIIDIGAALLADKPQMFDVIVTLNLYGDIISDIAAQVSGSVGMCGSANIGENFAMFEAIHGSAPTIAGQNVANPSGLLNAAIMMLVHLGQPAIAAKINNAWLRTIEDGIHTGDIYKEGISSKKVGTKEFADAVIERLGQLPQQSAPITFSLDDKKDLKIKTKTYPVKTKTLVGVDVFIDWKGNPEEIGAKLQKLNVENLKLQLITNGGVKVFPGGNVETSCTDQWRCRFMSQGENISNQHIVNLLGIIHDTGGYDFIKIENLYNFDDVRGYSLGQGE